VDWKSNISHIPKIVIIMPQKGRKCEKKVQKELQSLTFSSPKLAPVNFRSQNQKNKLRRRK